MKFRWLYFFISSVVVLSGMYSLVRYGVKFGVEFTGGTLTEYKLKNSIDQPVLEKLFEDQGIELSSVQKTGSGSYILKFGIISNDQRNAVKSSLEEVSGGVEELRFESVGPVAGKELIKKTVYGLVVAAGGILFWVALQFKSIKFGISAVLAMIHDSLVTVGMFSIFGHLWGAEIDLLFVTAILTILSFSVHDTIVLYDRIRESKKFFGDDLLGLANRAISETMVRSLNNTFVVVFMMVALLLLGGETIRWFIAALLIGTITGAYSSPFVAVPILVTWDEILNKSKKNK